MLQHFERDFKTAGTHGCRRGSRHPQGKGIRGRQHRRTASEPIMRVLTLLALLSISLSAQTTDAGRRTFESQCARCHGPQGEGGELGPAITGTVAARSEPELSAIITSGRPGRGMPALQMQSGELNSLLIFLHTFAPPGRAGE